MRSNQPAQDTFDRHHAVVIGGSMAGLLAARVLSDQFAQVTIIERDRLTGDAEARKGVPQGRHVHGWLARGVAIMGEYFPDLFPTLAQDGAIAVGTEGIRWNQLGVWMAPVSSPVKTLFQSRPFLEQHVRDQLAARDNVHIIDACEVSHLCTHHDRITGAVLRYRSGKQHEEALAADLIVDASGRGSRAPQWLNSLGYGKVQETSVKIDVGYATRIYRCPTHLPPDWKALFIFGRPPDDKRGGGHPPHRGRLLDGHAARRAARLSPGRRGRFPGICSQPGSAGPLRSNSRRGTGHTYCGVQVFRESLAALRAHGTPPGGLDHYG